MHHTRAFTDSHHTMRCPCVKKTFIDGLHPMIIFKTKVMFYKTKLFRCHSQMIILFIKSLCLLWVAEFWSLAAGFAHCLHFLDFHRRSVVNQSGPFTRGSVWSFLLLLDISFPFYVTVRLYWTSSNGTEPTHQITNCVV